MIPSHSNFRNLGQVILRETCLPHNGEAECDAVGIANGPAVASRIGRDARRPRRYRRPHRTVVPVAPLSVLSGPPNGRHI